MLPCPLRLLQHDVSGAHALFHLRFALPADMPPGIYRLRLDFGVQTRKRRFSLCENSAFAGKSRDKEYASCAYSPPVPVSGRDVRGREVDASRIKPRVYAVLLARYNSNGSRGVVAREDENHFALSNRNIIPDETVLPLRNPQGKPRRLQSGASISGRLHRPQPQHPLGLHVRNPLRAGDRAVREP